MGERIREFNLEGKVKTARLARERNITLVPSSAFYDFLPMSRSARIEHDKEFRNPARLAVLQLSAIWHGLAKRPGHCLILLALTSLVFLKVLHDSQELSTTGPLLSSGAPEPAGDGSLVSPSFSCSRNRQYLVVMQGEITSPVVIELRNSAGKPVSSARLMRPDPGRPEARCWKTVKARERDTAARVHLTLENGAPARIHEISVRELDAFSGRRKWIASGLFVATIAAGCLMHRQRRLAHALALGCVYFLFLLPWKVPGYFAFTSDSKYFIPTALSFLERGDLDIDEYGGTDPGVYFAGDYRAMQGAGGHYFNTYPAGTSLVTLPLAGLGNWLHDQVPDPVERSHLIATMAARLLSAATVALVYLFMVELGGRAWMGFTAALIFGFATPHLAIHGGGLWSHTASSFLSALALWLCVWKEGRFAAWAALPLGIGFACRPTMAFPGLIIGAGLLLRNRRQFWHFATLSLVVGVAFVALSESMWGRILPPYYTNHASLQRNGPLAFLGTLVSPNRGLFIYCPVILFSILGAVRVWLLREPATWIHRLCSLVLVAEWVLASRNLQWWGGHSYGPRILSEALVFAMPLLIPAWDFIALRNRITRVCMVSLAALACAWGLFVQMRGLASADVYYWNARPEIDRHTERLWNWNDWQIFSGHD